MTTDTQPKLAMENCEIGNSKVKIFGIAKGYLMSAEASAKTYHNLSSKAKATSKTITALKPDITRIWNKVFSEKVLVVVFCSKISQP